MEVFKGERLLNEITSEHNVHPNMLTRWKTEASNNLHVGKLTAQYEWMKKIWNLMSIGMKESPWLILLTLFFSISTQAEMLNLNRTSLYYKQRPSSEWDLQLNRLIDITYTKHPEFGYPVSQHGWTSIMVFM